MPIIIRSGAATIVATASMLLPGGSMALAPSAAADPPRVAVSGCLRSARLGPNKLVTWVSATMPSAAGVRYQRFRINLRCGHNRFGIRHINQGHPIRSSGRNDKHVVRCLNNIARSLHNEPAEARGGENFALRIRRSNGGSAPVGVNYFTHNLVSLYTSGRGGRNDWGGCARERPELEIGSRMHLAKALAQP
jgi:hypothetical protein